MTEKNMEPQQQYGPPTTWINLGHQLGPLLPERRRLVTAQGMSRHPVNHESTQQNKLPHTLNFPLIVPHFSTSSLPNGLGTPLPRNNAIWHPNNMGQLGSARFCKKAYPCNLPLIAPHFCPNAVDSSLPKACPAIL